jgi:hypothetical protein
LGTKFLEKFYEHDHIVTLETLSLSVSLSTPFLALTLSRTLQALASVVRCGQTVFYFSIFFVVCSILFFGRSSPKVVDPFQTYFLEMQVNHRDPDNINTDRPQMHPPTHEHLLSALFYTPTLTQLRIYLSQCDR